MEQIADLHLQLEREKREKEDLLEMSKLSDSTKTTELDLKIESLRNAISDLSNDSQANRLVMSQVLTEGDKHKDILEEIAKLNQELGEKSNNWTELSKKVLIQESRLGEIEEGQAGQAEASKILESHPDTFEKLKQDLAQTQHEVADLRSLKGQIASLANPVEKMEGALKHLSGAVERVEEEEKKGREERQELKKDINEEIEKLKKDIEDEKSNQAETIKALENLHQRNEDFEKVKQDLLQTQLEVRDLSGLKDQIVSLSNPLEKMEVALKNLSGVVELVEDDVRKGKEGRQALEESINQETDLIRKDLSDEMAQLRLQLTAEKERSAEHPERLTDDVLEQVRAIKEDQGVLLSKLAEGEQEVKAIRTDQDSLLEKLVLGEKDVKEQVEVLQKEQAMLHNRMMEAEKEGRREMDQLASGTEAAVEEMRYMVDQKAEIQGIQEKVELLENQKLNTDTLQSVAGQLATNTLLIRGLVDWREKIEENGSKLDELERDVGDQADAVRGLQVEIEKSRVDLKDELSAAISDHFGGNSEEKSHELSSRIQKLSDETEKNLTHILSELEDFRKLTDKVETVEKENSILQEKIGDLSNRTDANNEEVLLRLTTLEKDSVNMEVITGQLEAAELGQKKLTRADIVQTSDEDMKLSSVAELDQKMALLERQWSEYSTNALLETKIDQLEKQRQSDLEALDKMNEDLNKLQQTPTQIEELKKNDDDHKTSLERCSSDNKDLSSRIEKLVQMLETVQEQVKESIPDKDQENLSPPAAEIKYLVETTQASVEKQKETIASLESTLSKQEERQNEAALRMTMLTSNINEKVSQHENETEAKIEGLSNLLDQLASSTSEIKGDVELQSEKLNTIESAMPENKLNHLETSYTECLEKLNLMEKRFPVETEAPEIAREVVQVAQLKKTQQPAVIEERLQGASAKDSSNEDLDATVEDLQAEVASLKETILKTEQNMSRIFEQTSVVLLRDAGQEERVGLVEQQQKELEAADVFLQEANRQLMEKVVHLESRLRKVEERMRQEQEVETNLDALTQMDRDLKEVKGKLQVIEERQVGGEEVKHVTSVQISPHLESRVERLEAFKMEADGKIDVLLQANEDIANTFISIKDDFKQTQSLTQKIQQMNIRGMHVTDLTEPNSMEKSIMTLTEQSNKVMEDVVRHEAEVREIRKDMKTDQNLIIIRFNTHKDTVEKLIQKVEEKVSFLEASQREEVGYPPGERLIISVLQSNQLASLERKASEYEDIYSRLEVRQAKEEKEETSPMVERSDEMKTLREYRAQIFPTYGHLGWSELSFLYVDITSFQCWHFPSG